MSDKPKVTSVWKSENATITPVRNDRCQVEGCAGIVTHVATFPGVLGEEVRLCTSHAGKGAVLQVLKKREAEAVIA